MLQFIRHQTDAILYSYKIYSDNEHCVLDISSAPLCEPLNDYTNYSKPTGRYTGNCSQCAFAFAHPYKAIVTSSFSLQHQITLSQLNATTKSSYAGETHGAKRDVRHDSNITYCTVFHCLHVPIFI
jgi:hypothetical protein